MKKFLILVSIFLSCSANSQNIANGTYIAKDKEQIIRLILKDNNYDLSFTTGQYEIKKDSVLFKDFERNQQTFNVKFKNNNEVNTEKIRIKLKIDGYDFYNIYFAVYNENTTPVFKRISDIQIDNPSNPDEEKIQNLVEFEIDKNDYLVLVKEDYLYRSEMCKFKIPKNTSNISVDIKDKTADNIKLAGKYNNENNELTITNNGKNPLVFVSENQMKNNLAEIAIPVEIKNIEKWTYPGKELTKIENVNPATDSTNEAISTEIKEPVKYNLNIENSLDAALLNTSKKSHKFLIIYYDPKNKSAKSSFNEIVAEQVKQLNYNMYADYDKKYDLFDYYLANKKDEKWLKSKNITTFPVVIAVNSDGDLLSQSNSTLFDLQNQFYYYDGFGTNITRANALVCFKKAISSTLNDTQTIKAFADLCALQIPYDETVKDAVPVTLDDAATVAVKNATQKIEEKTDFKEVIEEKQVIKEDSVITTTENVDTYIAPIREDIKPDSNTYIKPIFDKKQVQTTWSNLIQTHKNDAKPNIDLAVVIIKELNNNGFTKQIFNTEKLVDQTNMLAFDYLFKHFNAIEKARIDSTYNVDAIHDIDLLENAIKYILNGQIKLINPQTPIATQLKIINYYKQLLDIQKSSTFEKIDFSLQNDYFELLKTTAINSKSDKQFINEYSDFHDKLFDGKTSVIETLDNLFKNIKGVEYESETWTTFKNGYANSANNAAWYVVEHSKNPESIKKAIKWSEHSLKIEKNNHYYLDTLAQLYYKNGEKEKAIATQQLAIDNNFDDANQYIITRDKMKNGTY
jgi:hypothetical protein